jgi:hypothetical protein
MCHNILNVYLVNSSVHNLFKYVPIHQLKWFFFTEPIKRDNYDWFRRYIYLAELIGRLREYEMQINSARYIYLLLSHNDAVPHSK